MAFQVGFWLSLPPHGDAEGGQGAHLGHKNEVRCPMFQNCLLIIMTEKFSGLAKIIARLPQQTPVGLRLMGNHSGDKISTSKLIPLQLDLHVC